MSGLETRTNFEIFQESLSTSIVTASLLKSLRQSKEVRAEAAKNGGEVDAQREAEELGEFIEYLAKELWDSVPKDVRETSYDQKIADESGKVGTIDSVTSLLDNPPRTFVDSVIEAQILEDDDDVKKLLTTAMEAYFTTACAPPRKWSEVRPDNCELCERNVFLSYHHLIPRSQHARVKKKNIHPDHMLNRVAYLCRPCHGFVHSIEDNWELAQNWYTVELLETREDVQRWIAYTSKRPWRSKRQI